MTKAWICENGGVVFTNGSFPLEAGGWARAEWLDRPKDYRRPAVGLFIAADGAYFAKELDRTAEACKFHTIPFRGGGERKYEVLNRIPTDGRTVLLYTEVTDDD